MTGYNYSTDFPTTAGAFDEGLDYIDAFVTKLDPTGSALVYSTYLGGSQYEEGRGIAVDAAGNVYLAGQTSSEDFPTTAGAFDATPNGDYDAFVTMLDATGSTLVYSTYLGGSAAEQSNGIAVDAAGNAYVTGNTDSADFRPQRALSTQASTATMPS